MLAQQLKSSLARTVAQLPDQEEILQLIEDLKEAQCLRTSGAESNGGGLEDGFGDAWIQWAMLADKPRSTSYERAIHSTIRDNSVVVDLGAGSGLLSLFALEAGARRVSAIEESGIATKLRALKKNLPQSVKERFEIQNCNSFDAKIPPDTTHIVSELFGNDPFQEGVIPTLRDFFSRISCQDYVAIPHSCTVYAQLVHFKHGPLSRRIQLHAETQKTHSDGWQKAIQTIHSTLDFTDVSFAHPIRASDIEVASPLVQAFTIALAPPPPVSAQPPKHVCSLKAGTHMSAPALLLMFRAELTKSDSISNIPAAADCCEHWSPIVVPLSRAIKRGESVTCRVGISEDWCRVVASVDSTEHDVLGSRQ